MNLARLTVFSLLTLGIVVVCAPTAAKAGSIKVFPGPGASIQEAVDAALPGDKVVVYPGDYTETHGNTVAVRITKPLQLIGKGKPGAPVRLLPGPNNKDGIKVEPAVDGDPDIDGIRIQGFTIEGFSNNGIWLRYVKNYKILKNTSINNLENGIWPTLSANGMVKSNVAYGSEDSALWVEASENVRVLKNEFYHSPTGLEVTVSNNVEMAKNDVHDNTTGVGFYHPNGASLPALPVMLNWELKKNHVYNNNYPNTAPPGSMSAALPSGGGIAIVGTDGAIVEGNLIENNDFYGLSMVDWCLVQDCPTPPSTNPLPEFNIVQGNDLTNNGGSPDPSHPLAPYANDITYVVAVNAPNCFAQNTGGHTDVFGTGTFLVAGKCD